MKKQTVTTPETTVEEKLLRVCRQKEEADRNLNTLGSLSLCMLGLLTIMLYGGDCAELQADWLTIVIYVHSSIAMLLGFVGILITGTAGTYKCEVCGHTHVHADAFEILAFRLFGKKNLHCTYCNKKQPHERLPRARREK